MGYFLEMADSVVSGKFTGGITSAIRHPFTSIASGFKKVKSSVAKISLSITNDVKSKWKVLCSMLLEICDRIHRCPFEILKTCS